MTKNKKPNVGGPAAKSARRVAIGLLFWLLLLSLWATPVSAADITVNISAAAILEDNMCSLAEAIINSNNNAQTHDDCRGDTDGADIITLSVDVDLGTTALPAITSDIALRGATSLRRRVRISRSATSAVGNMFDVNGDVEVEFKNLEITNNQNANSNNGALQIQGSADVEIDGVTFKDNRSTGNGAAIRGLTSAGNVAITNSTFSNNATSGSSIHGGAIYLDNANGTVTISNSIFENNQAPGTGAQGGALHASNASGTLTITNSIFRTNQSHHSGGAIFTQDLATVSISGSQFRNNDNVTITGSSGGSGGAISIDDTSSPFTSATVSTSLFASNSSNADGGAIRARGTLQVFRSVFDSNDADNDGGAILALMNTRVENSTFYNNVSDTTDGGAIHADQTHGNFEINVRHVTFVDNEATGASRNGNAFSADSGITANMYNSIIAHRETATGGSATTGDDCAGLDLNTNNIIEDGTCQTPEEFEVDPRLAGRRESQGFVFFSPQNGSPALDAADDAECGNLRNLVDQRGVERPVLPDKCDIGAIEGVVASGGGGGGGRGRRGGGREDPTPTPTPDPRCAECDELMAKGFLVSATHGLASGIQLRRLGRDAIGNQAVLDAGFLDAIDAFGYVGQGVEVCFPAVGRLILLDAATSPRAQIPLTAYSRDGKTCANIQRAGTVVLLTGPPAPALANPGLPNCMVTTDDVLNFRESPGGARVFATGTDGAQVSGWVPEGVTLMAMERTAEWFKVDFHGVHGWISAGYVTPQGECAAMGSSGGLVPTEKGPPPPPGSPFMQGCMVTTADVLNFRETPGGARLYATDVLGRQIPGYLPEGATLTAVERTPDWFKVDYHGVQGWISAGYVTTSGNCG